MRDAGGAAAEAAGIYFVAEIDETPRSLLQWGLPPHRETYAR
jgi:hypothetical protein